MAQPARPPAAYRSQNGAGQQPYSNGPVQNQMMHSSDAQGYSPSVPGPYSHQTPSKAPPHPSSGQYNYSGSPNVSQFNSYQGPGQTLNRPPAAPPSGSPVQQTGPGAQVLPPAMQNSAAVSSAGGFPPGASPPMLPNWQYSQAPVSHPAAVQPSHPAPVAGTGPAQPPPLLAGNTNPPGTYQYAAPPGGPSLQNSYMKPGSVPPPVTQPLTPLHPPSRPPLGPPPVGGPPLIRPSAMTAGPPNTQPLLHSATNQEGDATSAAGDGSVVQNSYDAIEGGGLMVPEEFMYNPVTRVYGEPHKRPEVQNATIEFMAPSEYMLRPPQPPVYLFVFDVSHNAIETGYLNTVCKTLLDNLDLLPGNTRTKIGFITFDSTIHFYSLQEGLSQPQMLIVSDIEDVFIPMPENLLVNLNENKEDIHLTPSTDFYKKLALDCSGQQVAVDLFLLSGQYSDLASLGCISRYSAGSVYYYQSYHHKHNPVQVEKLQKELKRYLTRKIGFEAVMRIRCTKGLSIHTFHGNFFVRSTDLLSLPNVNPDAGYAVQMSVEESLTDMQVVSFQSALLYTSSKGERRIRVHTMCLPVVTALSDVYLGADVQAITGLLANMAVDRSVSATLSDARDALVNAVIDSLSAYRSSVLSIQQPGLMAPSSLRLFPLYVLALLKQKAFQTGTSARLDERIFSMCQVKNQPLVYLMLMTHPSLYRVDNLTDEGALNVNDRTIPQPPILQLSVEKLSREGAYLMDAGSVMFLWIGKSCGQNFISQVLGVPNYGSIPQNMVCVVVLYANCTVLPEYCLQKH
ncbi:hypothetical protein ASZ78_002002 [Callipepla squamata]|uniref:Protein transport protein Sec24A n=1 Tax=Callipepla squamata TaxID=9009 RepID=A0A226MXG4_CALSU|nr:hypothetical protein ASZ78_002002 [Callipepla squamata]